MKTMPLPRRFRRFLRAEEAVSALEYALLAGIIVVGIGAAIVTFQDTITAAIAAIGTDVTTATNVQGAANPNP